MSANTAEQVWSLVQEDPPERETATHSNIAACRNPRTEVPGGLLSMGGGLKRVGHNLATEQQQQKKK